MNNKQYRKNKFKKIIIWGHKNSRHTHFHIHYGYYKAFKFLGYDTFWFDNQDKIDDFDFDYSLFFTEDQAHHGIPLKKLSSYVLHNCRLDKYIEFGCDFINLVNYLNTFKQCFEKKQSGLEGLNAYTYYEDSTRSLIQPWATDLLPYEFSETIHRLNNDHKHVNYVGTVWGPNEDLIAQFDRACRSHGKIFKNHVSFGAAWKANQSVLGAGVRKIVSKIADQFFPTPIDESCARKLVLNSYIAPDLRNMDHVNRGYIPCRIFKNISYGKIPATNSVYIQNFFSEQLPYSCDMDSLFDVNVSLLSNPKNITNYKNVLFEVRNNHTYINRINSILEILK
jgi:hypothetical protein